ncbi:spondin-1 isoform X2 [Aricia agestis]|uniref:spondin-1 isoform X2 n=1 Tax=Aricia agestis TaxID=91739 RepID=UPI001C2051E1|nr:spondin-1 isoform X2 [Aricia agestis]
MVFACSMWGLAALLLVGVAGACELRPRSAGLQSPGDNHYRLLINGDVERYAPEQRYVVTLVGSRTHSVVQQFTRFQLTLEPLAPGTARSRRQGRFELFADTLTKFHEECTNSVVEADDLPKTEVQVMWKAPPAGSGCVLLKAMVYENASRWFAEDGQLTRRVCEDTSLDVTDCCACDDAKYRMVFEGLWSEHTHPKDYPKEAQWLTHFSDVIGATHPKNFSFWGEGEIATDGFRSLAEWGSVGLLERELQQRRGLRSIVKAQGLWYPKVNTNTTAAFTVDRKRHLLSLASMFGPSPDWVVGVSGLSLCARDCSWVPHKVIDLYPYDAGTDNGISYMSPNSETIPREKMYRITTMYPEDPRAPFYNPGGEIRPMARLYLTREKIIPRSCDEEVLQALVTEEAENTQSTNKPECAVSEWGAWSPCSVTCGKGLRMRTREYRMPQKAQMFACDRQLVSKEMCVAAVPECEDDGVNEADSEPGVSDGACAVSEWGPWSECSVTCGVGVATRRRQFLDRMGPKKCPLVQIEENQKCMQPACTEEEGAGEGVSDPTCPTTPWSSWSACSASCGRGVAFRTRLLLVPAARQADCAARVELLQHRPCTERDSCEIDMLTAKRICMEAPEQGPCRGVYQRWAFVAMKGMCVPFTYGGCRGNQNNFISQDDCTKTCSVLLGGSAGGPGAPSGAAPLPPAVNAAGAEGSTVAGPQPEDCVVSAWSPWSRCSVTCGTGYQQRTRQVLAQPRPGGAACPSRLEHRRRCYRPC